jgi:N-acetyl-alpha-D-muramate 1-phosphate uridylyltransferase
MTTSGTISRSRAGRRALILAAGLGERMQPLTLKRPKPLIAVAGKPIIAYAIERLAAAGISEAVVNVHYLPEAIEAWAAGIERPRLIISDERAALLDTGGGVKNALGLLGPDPFFVLNGDSFWVEGAQPALERLRAAWDDRRMDCLLLVAAMTSAVGFGGRGDFLMGPDGRLARRPQGEIAPFAYAGCYLVHPRLFADSPDGPFSMNLLWDRALAKGRLHGLRHDGAWIHVGTPDAIAQAERALAKL